MVTYASPRSVIINVRQVAAAATETITYTFSKRAKLKAVEALNDTTPASYCAIYLKMGSQLCALGDSIRIHSYYNGAVDSTYQEKIAVNRAAGLDIWVDGTFTVVAEFAACVAGDVIWLKLLFELEDEITI